MTVSEGGHNIHQVHIELELADRYYDVCRWATVTLDLDNYTLTVLSDCGCFGSTWDPYRGVEPFLLLLCRLDEEYLLKKLSEQTVSDNKLAVQAIAHIFCSHVAPFLREQFNVKECALCGCPFIPHSSRHRFCSGAAPGCDGVPCEEVGPQKLYRKAVDGDVVLKTYEKNYKTYHRWVRCAEKELPTECVDNDVVLADIVQNYHNWHQKAIQARTAYQAGLMGKREAISKMKVPPVPERSMLYFTWGPTRPKPGSHED